MTQFVVTTTTFQNGKKDNKRSIQACSYADAITLAQALENATSDTIERHVDIGISVPLSDKTEIVSITGLPALIKTLQQMQREVEEAQAVRSKRGAAVPAY